MPIKVKTRKILWSKSGNRCAFCKKILVQKIEVNNSEFIVGEECHIISSKKNGPRGKIIELSDYDDYDNLILLCANDHKLVDDFPETFTQGILISLKSNHEKWIERAIEKDLEDYLRSENIEILEEVSDHVQLDLIIQNCHFHFFNSNTIIDEDLAIEIGEFFDDLTEFSDIYSDIGMANQKKSLIAYQKNIEEFNKRGIRFFGKDLVRKYKFENTPASDYRIAMIIAYDPTVNPSSIQNGKLVIKTPDNFFPTSL